MPTIYSINPYNQKKIREFKPWTEDRVEHTLDLAHKAYHHWRLQSYAHRAEAFTRLAQLLRAEKEECAKLITLEMGKLIGEARSEVEKCAWVCEEYAKKAEEFLAPINAPSDAQQSFIRFDPIGAVLAIMPWNFPFWQVFRYAAPTLMAGNVTLMKQAPNVWGCAEKMEELFLKAGFPEGVFQQLPIEVPMVEQVIAADIVQGVTLTGSSKAGRSVAALSGKYLKPSVLELGGSDPFIVLADAEVEEAASFAAKSRLLNAGQSCIAAKRFLVERKIADDFLQCLMSEIQDLKVGNPMQEATKLAPMARIDLAEQLQKQVKKSVEAGAKVMLGGGVEDTHFNPTILTGVKPDMPAFDEELFGPVFAVTMVESPQDALKLANKTAYGLGATVWTESKESQKYFTQHLQAGAVFINSMVKSDPRLPFGGVKQSGYGRELGAFGARAFTNIKTVYIGG